MSKAQDPLLSVVIPTYKRPAYLARAIRSALNASPDNSVEVIVVPNGPDHSWRSVAEAFSAEERVAWHPIAQGNANAARNHGMAFSRGDFIRFLDDDDVLATTGAVAQLALIERTKADICSAPIDVVDDNGNVFDTLSQPDTPDFIAGLLSHRRMHQTTAHLFRRSTVQSTPWDSSLSFSQDIDWILRLCHDRDLLWVKTSSVCGSWTRHTSTRITISAPFHEKKKVMAEQLLKLVHALDRRGALTASRREAAAQGLWDCVHQTLFASPQYWASVAKSASALSPNSKPDLPMHYSALGLLGVTPLTIERAVAPKRMIEYGWRRILLSLGILRRW